MNDNGAGLSALAAIATAAIAVLTLLRASRDSSDRTRPMIVAEMLPAEHDSNTIDFVLRNYGQSLARDVKVAFDPPLYVPDGSDAVLTPYLIQRYQALIPTLSPGQELKNVWWSGIDKGGDDLENSESTPDKALVTVTYRAPQGRRTYTDVFPLDVKTIKMTTFATSSTSLPGRLKTIDASLSSIARSMRATATAAAKGATAAGALRTHSAVEHEAAGDTGTGEHRKEAHPSEGRWASFRRWSYTTAAVLAAALRRSGK